MSLTDQLCALLCLLVAVHAELDQHQLELKQHYEHLAYIAEFKCHIPQPRVIPVHHLFPETEIEGKAYFPDVTVLHRCDDAAGCCTSGLHCRPTHSHPVELPFKVTFLDATEHHKRGSWIIEYYTVKNHTECACVSPPPADACHEDMEEEHHSSSTTESSYESIVDKVADPQVLDIDTRGIVSSTTEAEQVVTEATEEQPVVSDIDQTLAAAFQ